MGYDLELLKRVKSALQAYREWKRQNPYSGVGWEYPYNEFAPNFVAFKPYIGPASLGNYMRIARKLAQPIQKGTKQSYQKQLQLLRAEPKATTWNMLNPRGLLYASWFPPSGPDYRSKLEQKMDELIKVLKRYQRDSMKGRPHFPHARDMLNYLDKTL